MLATRLCFGILQHFDIAIYAKQKFWSVSQRCDSTDTWLSARFFRTQTHKHTHSTHTLAVCGCNNANEFIHIISLRPKARAIITQIFANNNGATRPATPLEPQLHELGWWQLAEYGWNPNTNTPYPNWRPCSCIAASLVLNSNPHLRSIRGDFEPQRRVAFVCRTCRNFFMLRLWKNLVAHFYVISLFFGRQRAKCPSAAAVGQAGGWGQTGSIRVAKWPPAALNEHESDCQ